jgi:hypothetical protein
MLAIRFSGTANDELIRTKTDELRRYAAAKKLATVGEPLLAFYNPPWTLPFLRRNEVMLELAARRLNLGKTWQVQKGRHFMRLRDCHNFHDFRRLAERRLPGPIFNYIDGAADDETTHRRNTASFERCDLVPNVLRGVATIDTCR